MKVNKYDHVSPHEISSDIMKLTLELKHPNKDIMVSGIVPRMDKFNDKGIQANNVLKSECKKYNFLFIDNENISTKKHLNGSGLHLNYNGKLMLVNNFLSYIKIWNSS